MADREQNRLIQAAEKEKMEIVGRAISKELYDRNIGGFKVEVRGETYIPDGGTVGDYKFCLQPADVRNEPEIPMIDKANGAFDKLREFIKQKHGGTYRDRMFTGGRLVENKNTTGSNANGEYAIGFKAEAIGQLVDALNAHFLSPTNQISIEQIRAIQPSVPGTSPAP